MPFIEITVVTPAREVLVDVTRQVQDALASAHAGSSGATDGRTSAICLFVPHTTAAVTINEGADPAVARDIIEDLARLVPRRSGHHHSEGNSDAHVKASLMGSSAIVPLEQGRLRLGTWQSIYLAEFDGPRTRKVWIVPVT